MLALAHWTGGDLKAAQRTHSEGIAVLNGQDLRKVTPLIDRIYSLSQTPDAMRYVEEGRARGKVVISM